MALLVFGWVLPFKLSAGLDWSPLLQASRTGDTPMIAELLKAGADVKKSIHPEGETPLMAASRTGKLDAVALLLKAESDPNAADTYQKETALMWAAEEGHVPAMYELGLLCSDPNEKRRWLEEAARNGWQAAMMELAEMGY